MDLLYIKILKSPSMKLWRHGGIKWVMLCLCKESSMCIWSVPKCTTNERAAWSSKLDNHDCVTTAPRKHGSDGYFATTWLQRKLGNWLSYVVCDQSLHRLQGWPESEWPMVPHRHGWCAIWCTMQTADEAREPGQPYGSWTGNKYGTGVGSMIHL